MKAQSPPSWHCSAAMSSSPALDSFSSKLLALFAFVSETFHKIPGSPILTRYIASSYQNDPFRSLLELFLLAFAIRTIAQSRTRASASGSNFVKLDNKACDTARMKHINLNVP